MRLLREYFNCESNGKTWWHANTEKTVKMNHLCQYKTYTIGPPPPSDKVSMSGVGDEAPVDAGAAVRSIPRSSAPIALRCVVFKC